MHKVTPIHEQEAKTILFHDTCKVAVIEQGIAQVGASITTQQVIGATAHQDVLAIG